MNPARLAWLLLLTSALAVVGIGRAAEDECYIYTYGMWTAGTPSGVLSQFIAWSNEQSAPTETSTGTQYTAGTCTGLVCSYTTACVDATEFPGSCGGPGSGAGSITVTQVPGPCPEECTAKAGKKKSFWLEPDQAHTDERSDGENCGMEFKSRTCYAAEEGLRAMCIISYEYTGALAGEGADPENGKQGDCASGPGGTLCKEEDGADGDDGEECVSLNGDTICFEPQPDPPSGCIAMESGGVLCVDDASVKPDNGTEGVDATPTAVTDAGGKTFNWYSSSVVNNSTTTVVTTNNHGGGGGGGGGGTNLDNLKGGTMAEVQSFGELLQAFYTSVDGSPLVTAVKGVSSSFPTGSCPSWSTSVNAGVTAFEMDFGFICTMWDSISGVISAVMLAAWAWLAIRILMSA